MYLVYDFRNKYIESVESWIVLIVLVLHRRQNVDESAARQRSHQQIRTMINYLVVRRLGTQRVQH